MILNNFLFQRCLQPAQQQGRRISLRILSRPTVIRRALVSSCLADVIQQIHSLRASGVISSHRESALGSEARAFRKSTGILCATPAVEIFRPRRIRLGRTFLFIRLYYTRLFYEYIIIYSIIPSGYIKILLTIVMRLLCLPNFEKG